MMNTEKENHIYTVTKLTREIKTLLEERFSFLWVTGEISNLAVPASGHSYFSLKDDKAVISAVMFKNQRRKLTFVPENGMKITGLARISLYEPRGSYQLIFEHLAPDGAGALQVAFEQLKEKLAAQGLFDPAAKKKIPFLPDRISVITSGTGAAVRDIIHVAGRRFPACHLEIVPVRVQGDGAEYEIAAALDAVNTLGRSDLIILARGGGSIEDLWAFNTEIVARAIFQSSVPVITGVGHETDFTIADFVADLRAPTPSAAAEMALPDRLELLRTVIQQQTGLHTAMKKRLEYLGQHIDDLESRLKSPQKIIQEFGERVDELTGRLNRGLTHRVSKGRERLFWLRRTLDNALPRLGLSEHRAAVERLQQRLAQAMASRVSTARGQLNEVSARLSPLNPQAVLDRGYSIARIPETGKIVTDASSVNSEDRLEIILSKGRLVTRVE